MVDAMMAALVALALAGQAAPSAPTMPAETGSPCPAGAAVALPPELKGWTAMQGVTAGKGPAAPTTLAMGRSVRARLLPSASVTYPLTPEHVPDEGSGGGLFAFDVATAGTYRVALGAAAWVDVVAGGKAVASAAHGHGAECSGVRKQVDYRLQPGRYLLQVSGSKAPSLAVMVTQLGA